MKTVQGGIEITTSLTISQSCLPSPHDAFYSIQVSSPVRLPPFFHINSCRCRGRSWEMPLANDTRHSKENSTGSSLASALQLRSLLS